MRDGRIGEQALDVGLYEGTYVAQGHGEGSGDPEKPEASWSIDGKYYPEEDGEGGGLGSRRHKAHNRGGCAFIDVGRPDVERGDSDFESQADEHHGHSRINQQANVAGLQFLRNYVDIG